MMNQPENHSRKYSYSLHVTETRISTNLMGYVACLIYRLDLT